MTTKRALKARNMIDDKQAGDNYFHDHDNGTKRLLESHKYDYSTFLDCLSDVPDTCELRMKHMNEWLENHGDTSLYVVDCHELATDSLAWLFAVVVTRRDVYGK